MIQKGIQTDESTNLPPFVYRIETKHLANKFMSKTYIPGSGFLVLL
jgi:hypothetical protein